MQKHILLISYIFLIIGFLTAQQKGLELIHADKTIGKKIAGEQVRIFEGLVHFRQDTMDMYCNSARFFSEKNRIDFMGSVLIDDGLRKLRADKIEYFPKTKFARCLKNVKITDAEDSLSTQLFTFDFNTEEARADSGMYVYNRTNRVHIWGQKGWYNPKQKMSRVEKNAKLMRIDSTGTDTLIITASEMKYQETAPPLALAIKNVRIKQGALTAICDTARFFPKDEIVQLIRQPRAWFDDNEMSGARMQIGFDSLGIKRIDIYEKAKAINRADSLKDEWNLLKGKEIHMDIKDKKPLRISAYGSASSTYYLKEEEESSGMNFATSDTIIVYFKESKADSIRIVGGAQGVYYPQDYKGVKKGAE